MHYNQIFIILLLKFLMLQELITTQWFHVAGKLVTKDFNPHGVGIKSL